MTKNGQILLGYGCAILPIVIYSLRTTGYAPEHLAIPVSVLDAPTGLATLAALIALGCAYRFLKSYPVTIGLLIGIGHMATGLLMKYPLDYKLWTYLMAPSGMQVAGVMFLIQFVVRKPKAQPSPAPYSSPAAGSESGEA